MSARAPAATGDPGFGVCWGHIQQGRCWQEKEILIYSDYKALICFLLVRSTVGCLHGTCPTPHAWALWLRALSMVPAPCAWALLLCPLSVVPVPHAWALWLCVLSKVLVPHAWALWFSPLSMVPAPRVWALWFCSLSMVPAPCTWALWLCALSLVPVPRAWALWFCPLSPGHLPLCFQIHCSRMTKVPPEVTSLLRVTAVTGTPVPSVRKQASLSCPVSCLLVLSQNCAI